MCQPPPCRQQMMRCNNPCGDSSATDETSTCSSSSNSSSSSSGSSSSSSSSSDDQYQSMLMQMCMQQNMMNCQPCYTSGPGGVAWCAAGSLGMQMMMNCSSSSSSSSSTSTDSSNSSSAPCVVRRPITASNRDCCNRDPRVTVRFEEHTLTSPVPTFHRAAPGGHIQRSFTCMPAIQEDAAESGKFNMQI